MAVPGAGQSEVLVITGVHLMVEPLTFTNLNSSRFLALLKPYNALYDSYNVL